VEETESHLSGEGRARRKRGGGELGVSRSLDWRDQNPSKLHFTARTSQPEHAHETHRILFLDGSARYQPHAHHICAASAVLVDEGVRATACPLQSCIDASAGNGDTNMVMHADTAGTHA
jgi:hypothetical protein